VQSDVAGGNVYGGHRMEHKSTEYREEYEENAMEQNRPLLVSTEVSRKILIKTKHLTKSYKKNTKLQDNKFS
jgi:hypothetical protein